MATTLIINPGSSSKKYVLYKDGELLFTMRFEKTESSFIVRTIKGGVKSRAKNISKNDFSGALSVLIAYAMKENYIKNSKDIDRVGIRIVASGTYFTNHRIIDEIYIEKLKEMYLVNPLHTPLMLQEIQTCKEILPHCLCVGVSDSEFHSTIPQHISSVSLPEDDVVSFDIKKFGYHGLSVSSVVSQLQERYKEVPKRTIVCHVGSGISITALQDGKSAETSMGYTPASGLMMSSRMGDVSADVFAVVAARKELSGVALLNYLYTEGGFKGVAGVQDFRLVLDRVSQQDVNAQKSLAMFIHQVHSFIGAYTVLLGGVDTIVLTATAVERNAHIRSLLLSDLTVLGVHLDEGKNEALVSGNGYIHAKESTVDLLVLRTNEMLEILKVVNAMRE